MDAKAAAASDRRGWWLAVVALAACGPWPAWSPPAWLLAALVGVLALAARPRGAAAVAWLGVTLAALGAAIGRPPAPIPEVLEARLTTHCERMLGLARAVAEDDELERLFAATGETLDPVRPFAVLDRLVGRPPGRTVLLADDRGNTVAWAGAAHAYPVGVRAIGPRRWGVVWSAGGATLYLREPLYIAGRLVGAVTVTDRTSLEASDVWGMRAPRGSVITVGEDHGATVLRVATAPGIAVPVRVATAPPRLEADLGWLGWSVAGAAALLWSPWAAVAIVAMAAASVSLVSGATAAGAVVVLLLAGGAALGRGVAGLRPAWARLTVLLALAAAISMALFDLLPGRVSWLPLHLLTPSWGGIWMVALAWLVTAWPRRSAGEPSLGWRLAVAVALAAGGVTLELARVPLELARLQPPLEAPRALPAEVTLERWLPAPVAACELFDLAPVIARRWNLLGWPAPAELQVVDDEGRELSRWGDLSWAGDQAELVRSWTLEGLPGARIDLWQASGPWSLLPAATADEDAHGPEQRQSWVVLTRSGAVAASFDPTVRDLDPTAAGSLYHAGGGWARVRLGSTMQPARVWRRGPWLLAAVARTPAPSVWVVKGAVATLWALLGLMLAWPPRLRRDDLATFGGRLRLLVGVAVVLPLVFLTVFLHLRLQREERRLERAFGLEALGSAAYTTVHLAGGVPLDDDLARWIARGWGGEVALFDGADLVAVSRPDLMSEGVIPELPVAEAYPGFLLGRREPTVVRVPHRLVVAGPVELQGRRLLLQLSRVDPVEARQGPGAVDWLLTGALLAALLVLVVTGRIEGRLSLSLRNLVELAGRLRNDEPIGEVSRPPERDLAAVLDAVHQMHQEVRERELSLRHQEELLRITLSTLQPAVLVLQTEGGIRFTNPAADRLLASCRDEVLLAVSRQVDATGSDGVGSSETVRPRPGDDLTWRVGVAPVPLPDGDRGFVAVIDDITEVVQADRLRQLTRLARIVAHEVKNPLTPIRLWVQELEEARRAGSPDLESLLAEACHEIGVQTERLQETASSFSNLVALERWEPEEVDLGALVEEVVRGYAVVRRRGVRLVVTLNRPGITVTADRHWLRRALDNLVKNSIDALAGEAGEIELRVRDLDRRAVVEVEDSAGGVPEEQLEDLFSPHFSTTSAGSGLGLALVRQVTARCQGSVAASLGERGLVVRLELPLLR